MEQMEESTEEFANTIKEFKDENGKYNKKELLAEFRKVQANNRTTISEMQAYFTKNKNFGIEVIGTGFYEKDSEEYKQAIKAFKEDKAKKEEMQVKKKEAEEKKDKKEEALKYIEEQCKSLMTKGEFEKSEIVDKVWPEIEELIQKDQAIGSKGIVTKNSVTSFVKKHSILLNGKYVYRSPEIVEAKICMSTHQLNGMTEELVLSILDNSGVKAPADEEELEEFLKEELGVEFDRKKNRYFSLKNSKTKKAKIDLDIEDLPEENKDEESEQIVYKSQLVKEIPDEEEEEDETLDVSSSGELLGSQNNSEISETKKKPKVTLKQKERKISSDEDQ